MTQAFGNFVDQKIMALVFGGTAYTPGATYTVGLSTTTVVQDGTGITEPVGNAYARASVANVAAQWTQAAVSGGGYQASNTNAISFPTATGSWGTITDWFIEDGTNLVAFGKLQVGGVNTSQTISNGNTISFGAGQLVIQNV
jgi:hypothetical protein